MIPSSPNEHVVFKETQRLYENRIARVAMLVCCAVTLAALVPLLPSRPDVLPGIVALGALLPAACLLIGMKTVVTNRRLIVTWVPPMPGRRIDRDLIIAAEPITYDPIGEGGGWGWRMSWRYHRVFNMSGNRAVHVRYGDRRSEQLLIGTRRPDELAAALATRSGPVDAPPDD